jgi:hypothetical protein
MAPAKAFTASKSRMHDSASQVFNLPPDSRLLSLVKFLPVLISPQAATISVAGTHLPQRCQSDRGHQRQPDRVQPAVDDHELGIDRIWILLTGRTCSAISIAARITSINAYL